VNPLTGQGKGRKEKRKISREKSTNHPRVEARMLPTFHDPKHGIPMQELLEGIEYRSTHRYSTVVTQEPLSILYAFISTCSLSHNSKGNLFFE